MTKRDRLRSSVCSAAFVALFLGTSCTASVQAEAKAGAGAEPAEDGDTRGEPQAAQAEPEDAPTELIDDGSPPATITVVYRRSQITACALVDEGGEKVCQPKTTQPHQGKGEVTFIPIDESGEDDPNREGVPLVFEDGQAEQSKEIELKKGRWLLEWKGEATAKERFKVVPKDRFEATLEGIAGMCELEGKSCKLQPQKTQQVIELPEVRIVH